MTARAILIDPTTRTVRVVQVDGDHKSLLGCDWLTAVSLDGRTSLYLDDEGRLVYPNPHGYFVLGNEIYCGRGLILGLDADGNDVSTDLPVALVAGAVRFVDGVPPEHLVAPMMTFVALDGDDLNTN